MSRELQYILVVTIAWLIVAGLIIIPRFIKRKPIKTNTTIATNATNADIVNAIYSLHNAVDNIQNAIYSIQNTVYAATGIGIGVILAVMLSRK